ncbi:MAG: bifunctional 4'-phosphopantothenoylcysteine decarboxylase/phosphopantothenoylcysteine synthetase, partial [Anaerolineales bacterium]|nr:bifunctional 4'-phosphopantothenoylcysteine decarboxylase/phosphopantothenoylcysteine synthetase [Anaerolineales bacterium]
WRRIVRLVIAPARTAACSITLPIAGTSGRISRERGAMIIARLMVTCIGLTGTGRMIEPPEILGHIRIVFGKKGKLAGKKNRRHCRRELREAIDPVRVITNHSSGKQGYALAQAALDAGAEVCLITTPTALTPPVGANVINVKSVQEMLDAVLAESADVLIMAAARRTSRPKTVAKEK